VQDRAQAIQGCVGRVFDFAYRMTMDRARAAAVTRAAFARVPGVPAELAVLGAVAAEVGAGPRADSVSFDMLDEVLRGEATRSDVVGELSDSERGFLLWELKQTCLTAVLNCLPLGERAALALLAVLGLDEEAVAGALAISRSAVKVRLSRARQKLADYLAPRCEHMDPGNPCSCPRRVGVALGHGFVSLPRGPLPARPPYGRFGLAADGEDAPRRDVYAIYRSLPPPDVPADLLAALLGGGH
jgi:hypothetical protein